MTKKKTIPEFKSIEEEANFWDTHSMVDYVDLSKPIKLEYAPAKEKKESLVLRLDSKTKKVLKKSAQKKNISTSSLARMWLTQRLREEAEEEYGV